VYNTVISQNRRDLGLKMSPRDGIFVGASYKAALVARSPEIKSYNLRPGGAKNTIVSMLTAYQKYCSKKLKMLPTLPVHAMYN
jgi:hypothetical protein